MDRSRRSPMILYNPCAGVCKMLLWDLIASEIFVDSKELANFNGKSS